MATLQSSKFTFSPLPSYSARSRRNQPIQVFLPSDYTSKPIKSALQFPDLAKTFSSSPRKIPKPNRFVLDQFTSTRRLHGNDIKDEDDITISKMYAILEAISDRIEMHNNIKEQRDNWNSLLLNSTNMITLTATLAATLADHGSHTLGLKLCSVILFSAATGLLAVMSKIQPCQLVEEQRNAVKLFKQLQTRIQIQLDRIGSVPVCESDVADAMEKVLAIDRAYPLPLLGAMIDKYPESYEPARWWPRRRVAVKSNGNNGWGEKMEEEMKEIVKVVKAKDLEDYERLGSKALKLSKALAVAGPTLSGIAAVGAALNQPLVAGVCGALSSVVSTVEHGGQVGMVLEMYRNCGGFFKQLEEDVENAMEEKAENGQVFEMKMALRLGRSLSELRDLAARCKTRGSVDEFASKLF